MNRILTFLLALLMPCASWASDMSSVQRDIAKVTLVAEHTGIVAGQPLQLGILLEPKEGWHTYWENPGDAGMATDLQWTLPEGSSVSGIDWPAPQKLSEGPLVSYAYKGTVFLPVTLTPPASLAGATYPIKVKASWLICNDICIPESAELELTLPVVTHTAPLSHAANVFAEHQQKRVNKLAALGQFRSEGDTLTISVPLAALHVNTIKAAQFFPRQQNMIHYAGEQKLLARNGALQLSMDKTDDAIEGDISGIVAIATDDNQPHYFDIAFTHAPAASAANTQQGSVTLPMAMLLALLGGIILNLMPCVLPVLSLKALALVKKAGSEPAAVRRQGIAYTLGILLSFMVIATVLMSLREAGSVIGWGYQMQSPAFVGFLIYLLFLVGLSLSGLFHLPVLLGNMGGAANEASAKGSFFTGVLATAVATPCTAPFMASAVGVALTLPPWQAMLIFQALGFGLALPFLLISFFPRLRSFLPRPGAWMETFKELLAFPMYGSVIWLLWVLTQQTGAGGMAITACGMLSMVITIWMKPLFREHMFAYRIVALLCYVLIFGTSLPVLNRLELGGLERQMEAMGLESIDFSKDKLAELRDSGTPVFVDATAAWCITCQLNGRTVLHTKRVMQAFKDHGITLMVADWTRRNDNITAFLESFGYKGVPLYVFFPARHGDAVVLPQLLTEDNVIDVISQKGD